MVRVKWNGSFIPCIVGLLVVVLCKLVRHREGWTVAWRVRLLCICTVRSAPLVQRRERDDFGYHELSLY